MTDPTDFDPFAPGRVFCVGLAGSGVRATAELLHGFGWEVSGTDRAKPDALARLAAKGVDATHDPGGRTWDGRPDFLLFSPAVPESDPARVRAAAEGVPQRTHIDVLAALSRRRETVAVAGTHGKSGTAAILVHLLRSGGRRVAGFVGAEPADPGYSFAHPDPELLVVEACEWNRHFLRLEPRHAVITGVDYDHPDSYRDDEAILTAFAKFRAGLPKGGTLVENTEQHLPWAWLVGPNSPARLVPVRSDGFGIGPNPNRRPDGWEFDTIGDDLRLGMNDWFLRTPLPFAAAGANVALGLVAAIELGADRDEAVAAIPTAPALRRRFERIGEWNGRILVDDYAHHPAGLRWVSHRARAVSPSGGTAVVFQPHQTLRTRKLFRQFEVALSKFDAAAVLPVFPARESASEKKCVKLTRDLAREAGPTATFLPDLDAVPGWADDSTRPGDVLVLAGAGDIDRARSLLFPPS